MKKISNILRFKLYNKIECIFTSEINISLNFEAWCDLKFELINELNMFDVSLNEGIK